MAQTYGRVTLLGKAPCKRCGKELVIASRSLYGLDQLKAETGVVCQDCTTPEETAALDRRIGEALANRMVKP